MLPEYGGVVLDTDDVAHELEASGGAAVPPIRKAFGGQVLSDDGSVDRVKLGRIVFSDSRALAKLDSIIHPLIVREVAAWLEKTADVRFKAVLVPLLFESGFDAVFQWDGILAVVCHEEEQLRRLRLRGHDDLEAHARIAAQLPCLEKAKRSDYTIWNDDDLSALRGEVAKALDALLI